jgi:hypothetical protein
MARRLQQQMENEIAEEDRKALAQSDALAQKLHAEYKTCEASVKRSRAEEEAASTLPETLSWNFTHALVTATGSGNLAAPIAAMKGAMVAIDGGWLAIHFLVISNSFYKCLLLTHDSLTHSYSQLLYHNTRPAAELHLLTHSYALPSCSCSSFSSFTHLLTYRPAADAQRDDCPSTHSLTHI